MRKNSKRERRQACALFSVPKKSVTFLTRFKYATFFVKLTLHEKSRFARQKA